MNIISGSFDSAYTMTGEKGITVTGDLITFTASDNKAIGLGERDNEGLTMYLFLHFGSVSLTGSWQERDDANELKFGGQVEFVPDGLDRFVGYWSMGEAEAQTNGTWVLLRNLGHTGIQS